MGSASAASVVLLSQVDAVDLVAQVVDQVLDLGDARAVALHLLLLVHRRDHRVHPRVDASDELVLAVVDLQQQQQHQATAQCRTRITGIIPSV